MPHSTDPHSNWVNRLDKALAQRVRDAIDKCESDENGCTIWSGRTDRHGYGEIRLRIDGRRKHIGAHRAAWMAECGEIEIGLVIDHLCRNRACINVEHMELVTMRENTLRSPLHGRGPSWGRPQSSQCTHGHEYVPENTHLYTGSDGYTRQVCIECRRRRSRESRARRAAEPRAEDVRRRGQGESWGKPPLGNISPA